jgi:hypothetical protein
MDLEKAYAIFSKIQGDIGCFKDNYGNFEDEFYYDRENPEQRFKSDNARYVIDLLTDAYYRLEWVNKPVIAEGRLVKNDEERYEIEDTSIVFTSGRPLDVWRYDEFDEKYEWVLTRVEHNGEDYYIKALGREAPIEGLKVRVR